MQLDTSLTYAGVPARTVRDALRRLTLRERHLRQDGREPLTTLGELAAAARTDPRTARDFASALVDADLLCVVRVQEVVGVQVTERGYAFANARLTTVRRATAARLLGEAVGRAREWNARPDPLYKVTQIVVFGSYLDPTRDRLGDLDLAIDLGWVGEPHWYYEIPHADGQTAWCAAMEHVRNRSRTISLHLLAEHLELLAAVPYQVVFTDRSVHDQSMRTASASPRS